MLENVGNETEFRQGTKDFLILVKQYSSADGHLNADEIQTRVEEVSERNRQLPGLPGPPVITDEDFLV
jgi:hypothetical protein